MASFFAERAGYELKIRGLEAQLNSFRTGAAYQNLRNSFLVELREKDRVNRELQEEIERLKKELDRNRFNWLQVNEDLHAEKEKLEQQKNLEIEAEQKKREEAERKLQEANEELERERKARQAIEAELEKARNTIQVLTAKKNKNSSNSSISSGMDPNHPKIPNNRTKTGLKPGAQVGHAHHPRPVYEPDIVIEVPTDPKFLDSELYEETGNMRSKQLVFGYLAVEVVEYQAKEFRNKKTGQRLTSAFPFGLTDDVTYDGSVKALAYVLNNVCNTSIRKTSEFLSEASNGKIEPSVGFISGLNASFSQLSEEERETALRNLATAPVFNIDFTFGRCNGRNKTVTIICSDEDVAYILKDHKGKEGIEGTPAEVNQGVCVSDHESTFTQLGSKHQECLEHVKRYSQGSIENEPDLTWNKVIHEWAAKTTRYRTSMAEDEELDPVVCKELIDMFYEGLRLGAMEYAIPPSKDAYREGYNLWKRMNDNPEHYILTLKDVRVPPTNNIAERFGRKHKRKIKQVMAFRSDETYSEYCDGLTVIELFRKQEGSMLHSVAEVFNRGLENYDECREQLGTAVHTI